jgi:DNA segregation ATPase FtsK/SpoIIIE-like protein
MKLFKKETVTKQDYYSGLFILYNHLTKELFAAFKDQYSEAKDIKSLHEEMKYLSIFIMHTSTSLEAYKVVAALAMKANENPNVFLETLNKRFHYYKDALDHYLKGDRQCFGNAIYGRCILGKNIDAEDKEFNARENVSVIEAVFTVPIYDYFRKFVKDALGKMKKDFKVEGELDEDDIKKDEKNDEELYEVAKEIIKNKQAASATLLQRELKIYYSQAKRIIDHFEKEGLVGPMEGANPREVFIK